MTIKLLSLSGGGWNSFSNLAGAMAGSLDRLDSQGKERETDALLGDYDYISGNSGGTWFLTSLGFSKDFKESLEIKSQADQYNTDGFNGKVKDFFNTLDDYYKLGKKMSVVEMLQDYDNSWGNFIEASVYEQIGDGKSIKDLDFTADSLQEWAKNPHLTFATALTKKSIVDKSGEKVSESNQFYPPVLSGDPMFFDFASKAFSGYSPSEEAGDEYSVSNFVPLSIELDKLNSSYRVTGGQPLSIHYSDNKYGGGVLEETKIYNNTGATSRMRAIDPSLASSAAVAAMAFPESYGKIGGGQNNAAEHFKKLATLASFNQKPGNLQLLIDEPAAKANMDKIMDDAKDKGYIRLADGGYLDNTSIAFNLSSAFNQGKLSEAKDSSEPAFEAHLFQNNSDDYSDQVDITGADNTEVSLPSDLAALFGLDSSSKTTEVSDNVIQHTASELWQISPHVFTSDSLTNSNLEATSLYKKDDLEISYLEIDVETINNDAYNIEGGVQGTLKIYLSINSSSDAIPWQESIHRDYSDNYNGWRTAIEGAPDNIGFFGDFN